NPLADVAVLIEPLTVVAKGGVQARAILDRLPYDPGYQRGLVLGAGPVGLLGAMVLVANGFEATVYSLEPEDSAQADLVRSLGGAYVSGASHPIETVAQHTGGFDVVLEAVGFAPVMLAATRALNANGVVILTGVPAEAGVAEINAGRFLREL